MKPTTYNIDALTIQRKKQAPQSIVATKPHRSKWKAMLETMKKGHWFEADMAMRQAAYAAGWTYAKGRFKTYKHPEKANRFVFVMVK